MTTHRSSVVGGYNGIRPFPNDNPFYTDLDRVLGDKIREDLYFAKLMWVALCNKDWVHTGHDLTICYTWRAAGDLLATMRQEGDYMTFYCSLNVVDEVDPRIESAMKEAGWTWTALK